MAILADDMPPTECLRVALARARLIKSRSYARLYYGCGILDQMGELPPRPGDKPRSDRDRVTELRWHCERFAEILAWDRGMADRVFYGKDHLRLVVMMMRSETGRYEGAYGRLLHWVDALAMKRIDPTVDTTL
jgi:hypothetical protein